MKDFTREALTKFHKGLPFIGERIISVDRENQKIKFPNNKYIKIDDKSGRLNQDVEKLREGDIVSGIFVLFQEETSDVTFHVYYLKSEYFSINESNKSELIKIERRIKIDKLFNES